MKELPLLILLGVKAFCSPEYLIFSESSLLRGLQDDPSDKKPLFLIKSAPVFFNQRLYFSHGEMLIYDLYHVLNYGKEDEEIRILGGLSSNRVDSQRLGGNAFLNWSVGSGIYLDIFRKRGLGALSGYSNTHLSGEIRVRLSAQILLAQSHVVEFALQFPIFSLKLLGDGGSNKILFVMRFLYKS